MDMRLALVIALAGVATIEAQTPALFRGGGVPSQPVMSIAVGGGEVLREVSVDRTGAIRGIKPLRTTAGFTERMIQAVRTWRFMPAETPIPAAQRKPGGPATERVDSKVLVAGVFLRPSVIGPTLGEPIQDVAVASTDIPVPTSLVTPALPPNARNTGVVLVEVHVHASGRVVDAKVLVSSSGFDVVALNTARQWTFRPARPGGVSAPAAAYIVFGFPAPQL
jgi:TonB family protein